MADVQKLTPFLMFQKGDAEAAMTFYTGLFADGEVLVLERYAAGEPGAEGTVKQGLIRLGEQQVRLFDSPPAHDFDFTPSMSLFVVCDSAEEQQKLWAGLSDGGAPMMPLDDYGFGPFGWTADRFGVSWQLSLG
jgi:predicted 3-demethylubiquinone-9 3-methyltransferase (glyoxalase superfamily)